MQKSFRFLIAAGALLLGLSSCSEDFDVLAPAKPYTVVYGILDPTESVNYVRIQKAYADPTKSALDLAKLSDSSYFPASSLTVSLYSVSNNNVATQLVADVPRVNMADEGIAKNGGTFFTTPAYAYKITTPLQAGQTYRLLIKNNDNGNTDTAQTQIVDISNVSISEFNSTTNPDQKVELTPTSVSNSDSDGFYSWRVIQYLPSGTVKFMNAVLRFGFWEQDSNGGPQTYKGFDYIFSRPANTGGTNWETKFPGARFNEFYVAIVNALGAAPDKKQRLADSVDLIAYFGSQELFTYQQNQVAVGGLGGDQIQYRYTNIRGKNVIGVLASRAKFVRRNVPLTNRTVDVLRTNPNTAICNIVGRSTQ